MNRLIIIGNGFDLAHGLKTSYKDFVIWYLAKSIGSLSYIPTPYEDALLKINFEHYNTFISFFYNNGLSSYKVEMEDLIDFVANCFKEQTIKDILNIQENNFSEYITYTKKNDNNKRQSDWYPFEITIKSDFLKRLIINCQDCNWVDIENEYFDQLKAYKQTDKFDIEKVKQLNIEFTYLRQKLEEYLSIQQQGAKIQVIPELLNSIHAVFKIEDFEPVMGYEGARTECGFDKTTKPEMRHNLYFLNFNYTDTIELYNDNHLQTEFSKAEINYIHGQLNKDNNPIIFGFGDEHDKEYLDFEEHRNNDLFRHIKSYQYLQTPNYRNLLHFLNSGHYQVFVMGHSCGLSDRTMFKEIFEHDHCKSIRLFHYNQDFHDKVINVSKHFSNKGHMRKLIVDYQATDAFPQAKY